jgi:glucose/arabinose dehydrogenase
MAGFTSLMLPQGEGIGKKLIRAKLENRKSDSNNHLYKWYKPKGQHFGSRIVLTTMAICILGWRTRGRVRQSTRHHPRQRKIYRLNADGSIPADNPLWGNQGAKEAIYSYGHRKPQPPRSNTKHDEINIIKGAYYG